MWQFARDILLILANISSELAILAAIAYLIRFYMRLDEKLIK